MLENVRGHSGECWIGRRSIAQDHPIVLPISLQILQCGGNLFDAVGAAVKAALYNTEVPRVIAATLDGGEPDIQLSDDLYDCIKLDVTNYPVVITVCKVCMHIDVWMFYSLKIPLSIILMNILFIQRLPSLL